VKGAVIFMTFTYDSFYDLCHIVSDGSYYFDFDIFDKDNAYISEGETVIAMLVGWQGEDGSAILLVPAKKEVGKYERIGIMEVKQKDFEDAKEMVIEII